MNPTETPVGISEGIRNKLFWEKFRENSKFNSQFLCKNPRFSHDFTWMFYRDLCMSFLEDSRPEPLLEVFSGSLQRSSRDFWQNFSLYFSGSSSWAFANSLSMFFAGFLRSCSQDWEDFVRHISSTFSSSFSRDLIFSGVPVGTCYAWAEEYYP